ncbi:putative toxin-antitoxin system toxin component, PIN family [Candidatus Pacearchaeota archaeon]|nr:putative toxin-antitoxin system toxin component, PIN family [Candidatus Pacearchaeota archaeon]
MRFVLDTNIILSALIKNGLTRKIITNLDFEFFTPSFALSEIFKYKKYICNKAKINEKQFEILFNKTFEYVEIIPMHYYRAHIPKSLDLIEDKKDISFLACAIALNAFIWSNDEHFKKQKIVKIFTTDEFIKKFLKKIDWFGALKGIGKFTRKDKMKDRF